MWFTYIQLEEEYKTTAYRSVQQDSEHHSICVEKTSSLVLQLNNAPVNYPIVPISLALHPTWVNFSLS